MVELLIGSFNNVAICLILSVIASVVSYITDDYYDKKELELERKKNKAARAKAMLDQDAFEKGFIFDAYIYLLSDSPVDNDLLNHFVDIKHGKSNIYTR